MPREPTDAPPPDTSPDHETGHDPDWGSGSRSDSEPTDPALMRQVCGGEAAAFEQVYERYHRAVFGTALQFLGDRDAAEDLTLEVFSRLWRDADRYDSSRGSLLTYLMLVTRSRALDHRRKQSRRRSTDGGGDGMVDNMPTTQSGPQERAALAEQRRHVRTALNGLNEQERQVVALSFLEGLSHSEIAERIGLPLGTVKTRIRNGLIHLRELLRNNGQGQEHER